MIGAYLPFVLTIKSVPDSLRNYFTLELKFIYFFLRTSALRTCFSKRDMIKVPKFFIQVKVQACI